MGGSLLRHENNHYRCSLMPMGSRSPAVTVTNVDFNSVHDNNLVSKVLYHTGHFIVFGKAGSST